MPDNAPAGRSAPRSHALRGVDRTMERRRLTYENEVKRLVDAGFALVQRTGRLEPTVGDIVAEAGLSNQAFYKHFHSKDELLLAMLEEGILLLRSYIEHRVSSGSNPTERVRNWLWGILEQALSEQAAAATRPFVISRARLAERFPTEVKQAEDGLNAILRSEIESGIQAGELEASHPELDSQLLYKLAMGWVERQLITPSVDARAEADHLVAFALRGLSQAEPSPA